MKCTSPDEDDEEVVIAVNEDGQVTEWSDQCQGHSTQCSQRDKCLFCGQTSLTSHCQ